MSEHENPTASTTTPPVDLEIKDAKLIFDAVWADLEQEIGLENLCFPRDIYWLNGAPGAGKGTQTRFIMEYKGLTSQPIVVSDLLHSPEARRLIDAGMMVGDREVTGLVVRKLLNEEFQNGAIVDGFPRTHVQVHILRMFYEKLNDLRERAIGTPRESRFHKPHFHIVVLFVDETEAVRRQLLRGQRAIDHNEHVRRSGMGEMMEVRKTDLSEEAARNRYRTFKHVTYEALKTLREVFQYHFIDAGGTVAQVQQSIVNELRYQSSLELDEKTFDRLRIIPLASEVVQHCRQDLVRRLDYYERTHPALFAKVVEMILFQFTPIIQMHSISGIAHFNTEDPLLNDRLALHMLIDIFSERGYHAAVNIDNMEIADRVDLPTGKIIMRTKKVHRFTIRFSGIELRRDR